MQVIAESVTGWISNMPFAFKGHHSHTGSICKYTGLPQEAATEGDSAASRHASGAGRFPDYSSSAALEVLRGLVTRLTETEVTGAMSIRPEVLVS